MTNEEMNAAAAELCGWKWTKCGRMVWDGKESHEVSFRILMSPQQMQDEKELWDAKQLPADGTEPKIEYGGPNYCQDRNALPELLAAVEREDRWAAYLNFLLEMLRANYTRYNHPTSQREIYNVHKAEAAQCVKAALRACGRWKD